VPWKVPSTAGDPSILDHRGTVRAVRTGIGTGEAEVVVRASRVSTVLEWAVESGAFAPTLAGRLFVRVVGAEGSPRAGQTVEIESPTVTAAAARTAADGVAALELSAIPTAPAGSAAGSGPTVVRLEVRAGSHLETVCAPVDPDATVRVGAEALTLAGGPLSVGLARATAVARAPVRVTALARRGDGWLPVAEALAGPGVDRVALEVPAAITGEVWIRARPLLAGGEPVRGGGILVYRALAEGFSARLSVEVGSARLALAGAGDDRVTAFAFALPEPEGQALLARLRETIDPIAAALDARTSAAGLGGLLAARTPIDVSAPSALRGGGTE
jgi:hypothetical protein